MSKIPYMPNVNPEWHSGVSAGRTAMAGRIQLRSYMHLAGEHVEKARGLMMKTIAEGKGYVSDYDHGFQLGMESELHEWIEDMKALPVPK